MKTILLMLFTLFYTAPSIASNCSTSERKLTIYFSNGMFTESDDAQHLVSELTKKVNQYLVSIIFLTT